MENIIYWAIRFNSTGSNYMRSGPWSKDSTQCARQSTASGLFPTRLKEFFRVFFFFSGCFLLRPLFNCCRRYERFGKILFAWYLSSEYGAISSQGQKRHYPRMGHVSLYSCAHFASKSSSLTISLPPTRVSFWLAVDFFFTERECIEKPMVIHANVGFWKKQF